MDAGATKYDLLYVSNSNGTVNVYKYWQNHALRGVLTNAADPVGECTDKKGNVYIVRLRHPIVAGRYSRICARRNDAAAHHQRRLV